MNQDDYERALDGDMNLSNTDLKGAIFTGAYLFDVNFSNADLTGAYFIDANMIEVYLKDANLTRADLTSYH